MNHSPSPFARPSPSDLGLAGAPAAGMPADRQARLAARQAFVALKLSFLYAVEGLQGQSALQYRVRMTETPQQLWDLRAEVYAALSGTEPDLSGRRQLLNRSLDSMFAESSFQLGAAGDSRFGPSGVDATGLARADAATATGPGIEVAAGGAALGR